MSNPPLASFTLAGQQLDIIDSIARHTADSAQSTATQAKTTADSAQSTATQAKTTANSAQSTANDIQEGFNTQFIQIPTSGTLISPYLCVRNNTVTVEFPNITPNSNISGGGWYNAFTVPVGYRPLTTVYRAVSVGATLQAIFEIATNGVTKIYSPSALQTNARFLDGFSYLTI